MKQVPTCLLASVFAMAGILMSYSASAADSLLRNLPPGVFLDSTTVVPPAQTKAIGQKLGGELERLENSMIRVHGRPIQVNTITATDESSAKAIHAAIAKSKSHPAFCIRRGRVVVEYVGKDIDAALATKTSYELCLVPKPASVRYRVIAELATVDKADYMSCTPLFGKFLALKGGTDQAMIQQISDLSAKFQFGRVLALRNPKLDNGAAVHLFKPSPTEAKDAGVSIVYSFTQLPARHGVPYVTATIDVTVDATGFRTSEAVPSKKLTAATPFWPADDPKVISLARQITAGKTTHEAKAKAILEWLTPGQNIKYAGQTGSRWTAAKVLEQKFGRCWDFSDCFVALARAAGVPSRQVGGWLYCSEGHIWAEYYREGKGWQQVDPTGGGKLECGIYHIPYFTSEDGEMPILYVSMPKIECVQTK